MLLCSPPHFEVVWTTCLRSVRRRCFGEIFWSKHGDATRVFTRQEWEFKQVLHREFYGANLWGKKKDVTSMKKFTVGVFSNKNYRSFVPTMAIQAAKQWGISSDLAVPRIPKVIHQIWVGPKEPPCLWLDTFRSDYLEAGG